MKNKPLLWLVIAVLGLAAGWLWLKPDGPRKRMRAQRIHTVNSLYMVTTTAGSTNAPPDVR